MNTRYWKFELRCIDGGWGWGATSDVKWMCAPGETQKLAMAFAQRHVPGGWKIRCLGRTESTFYLSNTVDGR